MERKVLASSKRRSIKLVLVFLLGLFLTVTLNPNQLQSLSPIATQKDISKFSLIAHMYNAKEAYSYVEELTKDQYEGRSSGTLGCEKAADWIASQFKSWNLKPYQEDSYFQPVSIALTFLKTKNVIGYIPAKDPTCQTSIIIGAHYDHIGKDVTGKSIMRGANDNASGTGVMMEFAQTISTNIIFSKVNIVFIAFTAEEKGLIGSKYYTEHPLFPLDKVVAMINFDMVGTGIGPWEIGTTLTDNSQTNQVLNRSFEYYKAPFRLAPWYLKAVSDHYPFFEHKVPVIFFFRANPTNIGGYHSLKDTIDTIDPNNLDKSGKVAILISLLLIKDFISIKPKYDFPSFPNFFQASQPINC